MADLIIKPATGDGNKLILQDKAGGAVLTTADSGATLGNSTQDNITRLGTVTTGVLAAGVTGGSGLTALGTVASGTIGGSSIINTSGAITTTGLATVAKIVETGGVLKENLITNSGFDVWSNSGGLYNPTTGAVPAVDDAGSLFINGDGDTMTGWTDNSGSGSNVGVSGGVFTFNGSAAYGLLTSQACVVTKGKLYQIGWDITTSGHATDELKIGTQSNGGSTIANLKTMGLFDASSTGTGLTAVWESTHTGNVYVTWRTGYAALRVDNLMMHEVTPACVASDVKACDGWYKSTTMDIYRQEPHATYTKDGSHYSCKVVSGSTADTLAWRSTADSAGNRSDAPHVARFAGRTVTFGAWVYTTEASHVKISIDTSGSSESAFHGGGGWEWMEMTQDVPAATTMFWTRLNHAKTGITSYVSQPMLVFGSSIGEGNYTRPTQEVIYLEGDCPLVALNARSLSDNEDPPIYLTSESRGKLPLSTKAIVNARMDIRDSGSGGSNVVGYIYPGTGFENGFAFNIGTDGLKLDNDDVYAVNLPYMRALNAGFTTNITTSGSSTFELDMFVRAIEI